MATAIPFARSNIPTELTRFMRATVEQGLQTSLPFSGGCKPKIPGTIIGGSKTAFSLIW
jgi:hypothetical protein